MTTSFPIRGSICTTALLLALSSNAGCNNQSVATKENPDPVVKVRAVAAVQQEVVRKTRQPATIQPFYETEIRSKVAGYIVEVSADIGDAVQAGQVLARVDVPEMEKRRTVLESKIALLRSKEEEAKAGVALAEAAVESEKAKLEQAKSQMLESEAILAAASAEFSRTQDLVNRGSLQARLLDESQKRFDSAKAAKSAVTSAVVSAESQVVVAAAQVAASKAKAQASRSETEVAVREMEELDVVLAFAQVRAPFAGVITQRHVNLGELIDGSQSTGSGTLFVLSMVDKVRIQVPVPEIDAPFIQPGDAITLSFPAFASEPPMSATVTRLNGRLDPSTRTITVEAVIDNEAGKLIPGMFGEAEIDMETKVATTMLPSRAVRFDEGGKAYVYLLSEENTVQVSEVSTGLDTGTEIEILSGLSMGQKVIGPHLSRFTDGQQVEPL